MSFLTVALFLAATVRKCEAGRTWFSFLKVETNNTTVPSSLPLVHDACVFDEALQRYKLIRGRRTSEGISPRDAWIQTSNGVGGDELGEVLTGDCQFLLNKECRVVDTPAGCSDGNPSTSDKCVWFGGKETLQSELNYPSAHLCSPFPSCVFASASCKHTPITFSELSSDDVFREEDPNNFLQAFEPENGAALHRAVFEERDSQGREWLSELNRKLSPLLSYHHHHGRSLKSKKGSPPKGKKIPKGSRSPPRSKKSSSPPKARTSPKSPKNQKFTSPPPKTKVPPPASVVRKTPPKKAPVVPKLPPPAADSEGGVLSFAPPPTDTSFSAPSPLDDGHFFPPDVTSSAPPPDSISSPPPPEFLSSPPPQTNPPFPPPPSVRPSPPPPGSRSFPPPPIKSTPPPKITSSPPPTTRSSPPPPRRTGGGPVINVKDYVSGNGVVDEMKGFTAAFVAACAASRGSSSPATLLIPSGVVVLTSPVFFNGGICGSGLIFQIDGTINALSDPNSYPTPATTLHALIYCTKFASLTFTGTGAVDGKGMQWWTLFKANKVPMDRPNLIYVHRSTNILVEGITFRNAGFKHLSFFGDDKVVVQNIVINSPYNSPNTDGIHISSTSNIVVQSSYIFCGDDNIAVFVGAKNVVLQDLECPSGHGISVGSLGGKGLACVSNVLAQRISLTGQNGVRIKTVKGGSGAAYGIHFKDIQLTDVSNSMVLNQFYAGGGGSTNVAIVNVDFNNIQGTTNKTQGIDFECDPNVPCVGINLNGINVQSTSGRLNPVVSNVFGVSNGVLSPAIPPLTTSGLTSLQMRAINNNMALCGYPAAF